MKRVIFYCSLPFFTMAICILMLQASGTISMKRWADNLAYAECRSLWFKAILSDPLNWIAVAATIVVILFGYKLIDYKLRLQRTK